MIGLAESSADKIDNGREAFRAQRPGLAVKPKAVNNRRLTLKDINLLMPEENNSLDSDEDKENYLRNL